MDRQARLARLCAALRDAERWIRSEAGKIEQRGVDSTFPEGFFRFSEMRYAITYDRDCNDPDYDDEYLYEMEGPVSALGGVFDDLRDRSGLSGDDLLRIGNVYVDFVYLGKYVSESLTDPNEQAPRVGVTRLVWDPNNRYFDERYRDEKMSRIEQGIRPSDFNELSAAEQAHCQRINAELGRIEKRTFLTHCSLAGELNARVASGDALDDYEVDVFVDHLLLPDDPFAGHRDSAILMRQGMIFMDKDPRNWPEFEEILGWDHCESIFCDESGNNHCSLYHNLYDHTDLDWKDLPRIDRIDATIEVQLQRFMKIQAVDRFLS